MLRKIIQTESEEYILHIPKEYLNKIIEIIVLPFENISKTRHKDNILSEKIKKTAGILKKREIDPIKWQNDIRAEWS